MYQDKNASVEVTYGLYSEYKKGRPYYNHKLSDVAAKELWEQCKDLIKENLMYWNNKPISNP
jgi:hypothetical protein